MTDSKSWWAQKLGNPAPAQQPQPVQQRLATLPPQYAPQGSSIANVPAQPPTDANQLVEANKALLQQELTTVPQKATGYRTETEDCPGCGGANYFSRANGIRRGHHPAPECFDCGYPLVQSGSGLGSLAGAVAAGGVRQAPQADTAFAPMNTIIGRVG